MSKTTSGKIKAKGVFEKDREYHKNHSMMIIPKLLEEYYINNVLPEDAISQYNDIFDYCKAVKGNKSIRYVDKIWDKSKFEFAEKNLNSRVNRYIVVNNGSKLIKIMPPLTDEDGNLKKDKLANYRKENPLQLDLFHFVDDVKISKNRESEVEAGYQTQILNRISSLEVKNYDVNYKYYIKECYKIINQIE